MTSSSRQYVGRVEYLAIKEAGLLNGEVVYIGGHQLKNELRYLRHNGPEHVIAYAPTKQATAEELSKMTGKKTVVQQKVSLSGRRSGHLGRASVSISEVARPLLTPDECSRLPGAKKDGVVIIPFLIALSSRGYAALLRFCIGVMPPMPMLGRSLLYVQSHFVA